MRNLDMKKTLKHLYKPSAKDVSVVDVPPMNYLIIDGKGSPDSDTYQASVQALYKTAYTIRATSKAAGTVFTVMPLEGLWTVAGQDAPPDDFTITQADRENFVWTLMILQPNHITVEIFTQAQENIRNGKDAPRLFEQVRFEQFHEGEVVQIMHIGAYADEAPTVSKLHQHIEANGWQPRGKHHEIYLSDPRKVAPEKLKTVIRAPFTRE